MVCLRAGMAALAVLLAAGFASAGSGKIKWTECKGDKDFERIAAECKQNGTPMMILFTSDMCGACQQLCGDGLSDNEVVKAAEKLVCVLADNGKLAKQSSRFKIQSIPNMVFLNCDGEEVGRMSDRTAKGLVRQFNELVEKHARAPKWAGDRDAAVEAGKSADMPAVVFYTDDAERGRLAEKFFGDAAVAELYAKFAWAKVVVAPKADEMKKAGISSLPTILVVDPRQDDPFAKPMKKLTLKNGAQLKADLAGLLKTWKPAEGTKTE